MREIKFKLAYYTDERQDTEKEGWIISQPILLTDFLSGEESQFNFSDGGYLGFDDVDWKTDKTEWLEYTGLKSKSGVEIFEGDILKVEEFEEQIFEVRWGGVGWVLFSKLFKKFGLPDGDTCSEYNTKGYTNKSEIIGNIWQNPELIKK